jgi:lipopolysaccharide/colanic/teichoic acid biosynthesis glycosyltransferase
MNYKLEKLIGLSKPIELLGLVASWLLVSGLFFSSVRATPMTYAVWIGLASGMSLVCLDWLGFFELHVPKPKMSGFVSLFLAIPVSAFLAKWVVAAALPAPPQIGNVEASCAVVLVVVVFGSAQELIARIQRAVGAQCTLLTCLQPEDLAALHAQIQDREAASWVRIRPLEAEPAGGSRRRSKQAVVISKRTANDLKDCSELISAHLSGRRIVDVSQLLRELRGRVDLSESDGWSFLLASTPQLLHIRLYFYLKTVLEPILATILIVLLLPVLLATAAAVLWSSAWPVIYAQERVGYRGKPFMMYKFRTMRTSAEDGGARWASAEDPRVTPLGRFLRRSRIDELPQLFNVIRGDLGFVGPRPERPEFYRMLSEHVPLFSMRLLVRPGITGWAQVRQGYAASVEESRTKLEYDLYYVQNMSHKFDFRVLVHTAAMMMRGGSGR